MADLHHCSVCGKSEGEVLCLVRGPSDIAICNECAAVAGAAQQPPVIRVAHDVRLKAEGEVE